MRTRPTVRGRRPDVRARALAVLLALLVIAVAARVLLAPPKVVTGVMPGSFTGYAFDACAAPSQRQMDAWRENSPYWAVGIYIAGENRACKRQANLDRSWVATQARRGWRLLPLSVGRQAPCTEGRSWSRIDPSPAGGYAAAREQGRTEADGAATAARDLGIAPRSTLWLDVEAFDSSRPRCREATLAYVSAWTQRLRESGYGSGVYSSSASGVRMLEGARVAAAKRYHLPQQMWVGDWNLRRDTVSTELARDGWPAGLVHQYAGPHEETHGGVTLEIDSDFMEVGGGTVAPPDRSRCTTARRHPTLRVGDRSAGVATLDCLLWREPSGAYTPATARAVARFQRARGMPATGVVGRRTWVALLSRGSRPLLKYGAGSDAVRRVQRALAAAGMRVPVTGVFEQRTARAVRGYQRAHGLPATGVVTAGVWRLLQSGR